MRTSALVLALLLVGAGGASSEDDPADPEVAPFPLVLRSDDRRDVLTTTVVDARTGGPIAGALVRGYAERVDGRAAALNTLLLTMATDAYGLAVGGVDTMGLRASHWIVSAKGYRPFAAYHGYWPPERVDLEPSTPMAVRVLDGYGDPVAHAVVEGYSGCPHAPPAFPGVTDAEGVFRVEDGAPEAFPLWVRADGCARTVEQLSPVFGDEPVVEVLSPGIVARGRLRDEDGRPVPGAVLRGTNYPRGPATLTDLGGRFVLAGLGAEEGVQVFHPTLRVEGEHTVERVAEDVPLDLTWTLDGLGPVGEFGTLVVRACDAGGRAVEGLHLLVLGADGQGEDAVTEEEGEAVLGLAAGAYRVRGDNPFDPFDVVEATVVVPPDGEAALDLQLSARPRLRLDGAVPADLYPVVVAAGREHFLGDGGEQEEVPPPVCLPAEARAVVGLRNLEQAWAFFVEVGPAVDDVRTARLRVPPAHRVRLADDDALDDAYAVLAPRAHPRVERSVVVVDGVVSIRWGGSFLLTVPSEDDTPDRVVPLELPSPTAGAVERRVDLEREGEPVTASGEARLVVTRADGAAVPELMVEGGRVGTSAWSGFRGMQDPPVQVWAPSRVLLRAPGLHPLQVDVTHPGEHEVVFPAGGIDLTTVDASGAPVASSVLVNGVFHKAPDGRLTLHGFAAGDHAVVVQRTAGPESVTESVRWRFTLSEGELRAKTLALP